MSAHSPDPTPYFLWGGAGLIMIIQVWRGWWSGLARAVAELAAVVLGYCGAYLFSYLMTPMLSLIGVPSAIVGFIGGALVFLVIYLGVVILAGTLFKRTGQQSFPPIRWIFGVGGALVGVCTGLVFVWVGVLAIRFYGTLAEPATLTARPLPSAVASRPPPPIPPWIEELVKMKRTLSTGGVGAAVQTVDPIPPKVYATTNKVGTVLASPPAMERFFNYPGVRPLAEHPKVAAVRNDTELLRAMQNGNYLRAMSNAALLDAANDPEVARLARRVDFEKALDYALAPAPGSR